MLDYELIVELDTAERLHAGWDALARACAMPLMAPSWLLAWWRHIAADSGLLRVVAVRNGSELVGLAPFHAERAKRSRRVDYRLLGIGFGGPLAPLSAPGHEWRVAEAISRALSRADPHPDLIALQGTPRSARWHVTLSDRWPGRIKPVSSVYMTRASPAVSLERLTLDAWLARRSSSFRSKMRRLKRRFDEAGGTWRLSTKATVENDLEIFQRLHEIRWRGRGESTLVSYGRRTTAMLTDVAHALIGEQRFRLWVMEIEGEAIGADIYLCGGGVVTGINGGWDERWKHLSPPLLATMHTIEDSIRRGERRVELGPGGGSHKTRFADVDSPVAWSVLMTPGRRLAQTFTLTAPLLVGTAARDLAKRVLTEDQVHGLGELRRRARRSVPRRAPAERR